VRDLLICLFLAAAVLAVFGQAGGFAFLAWDDTGYVTDNPRVASGLTAGGLRWALGSGAMANWHPLTWLSHMIDAELYGLDPRGHHRTSVLLHAANAVLLFLVLKRMTAAPWRSALVAGLFALHPLHVESVAWVSERKDVLSAFFWILTMGAYALYAERPGPLRYAWVVVLFALGLMAKPMLVTLPFVLLLLDVWPLGRLRGNPAPAGAPGRAGAARGGPAPPASRAGTGARSGAGAWGLVAEKVPLFLLAAVSSVVTFLVQRSAGAMPAMERLPLDARLANAAVAYWRYIGKLLWPADLSAFYPLRPWAAWQVGLSVLALAALTALALRAAGRAPWFLTGWLWYAGTLVPVIGVVQVGRQAMADRYTYLPLVGLFIAAVWGGAELSAAARLPRAAPAAAGALALAALAACSQAQVRVWRDTVTLFGHALEIDPDNPVAHNVLGFELAARGRGAEAEEHFRRALAAEPGYAAARYNLGLALAKQGRFAEAADQLEAAVGARPDYAEARRNLGGVYDRLGRAGDAEREYAEAVRLDPADAEARNDLGASLAARGSDAEAAVQYEEAIRLRPGYAEALNNLGVVRARQRRGREAEELYRRSLAAAPRGADARNNLGLLCYEQGRLVEAIEQFRQVLRDHPGHPSAEQALRLALAREGREGGTPR
jgi:Tfp pilus assembly protein PilF